MPLCILKSHSVSLSSPPRLFPSLLPFPPLSSPLQAFTLSSFDKVLLSLSLKHTFLNYELISSFPVFILHTLHFLNLTYNDFLFIVITPIETVLIWILTDRHVISQIITFYSLSYLSSNNTKYRSPVSLFETFLYIQDLPEYFCYCSSCAYLVTFLQSFLPLPLSHFLSSLWHITL